VLCVGQTCLHHSEKRIAFSYHFLSSRVQLRIQREPITIKGEQENTTREQQKMRSSLTGKRASSKKDHVEKLFFSHPDVYADVVNGTLFRGRKVITEERTEPRGKPWWLCGDA
jgi:hypothetical protein